MEKFFIINKESQFYKDWFRYKTDAEQNAKLYDDFAKEHGIKSDTFLPRTKYLCIVPTAQDCKKFKDDFTQDDIGHGLRKFKIRCSIGKDWSETVKNIKIADKPKYFYYGLRMLGHYSERCFDIDGILYGSLSGQNVELLDFMNEIKASEFYKIVEDYNSSIQEKNQCK